jgi:CMP-N-acetylneuraminic acid synthetase
MPSRIKDSALNNLKILAIIPARGGSKGLPGKNVKLLAGKPMIAWTIEAARRAQGVSRVIVSTDDAGIAGASREWGAEVPFLRPPELAKDETPGIAPVLHAVQWMEEHEKFCPDYIMLLQPTSPLRSTEDITAAIALAAAKDADSVISVAEAKSHPFWTMKIQADGTLLNFLGLDLEELQRRFPRRQDLLAAYVENGAIYLTKRSSLLATQSFYGKKIFAHVMPEERSIDIDSQRDFDLADLFLLESGNHETV